ncbi:MAG: SH3 domain-containing protein [Chloroflexi bacterium]|nr:SH3 domain-containing protein [Chloroflexota bacterium]
MWKSKMFNNKSPFFPILALASLLSFLIPAFTRQPVQAQEGGGAICYGWTSLDPENERVVSGRIDNSSYAQEWAFEGQKDTYATIKMVVEEGSLDPLIIVFDESGQRVISASANDPAGRRIVIVQNLNLTSDGEYTITATRLGEANGTSEGSYRLSLEPGISNVLPQGQKHSQIYDGEVLRETFSTSGETHVRYFEGNAGQQITIAVRNTDLTSTATTLRVSDGQRLNVREGPGTNFAILFTISPGTLVEQLETDEEWYRIRLDNGEEGWVGAQYMEVVQSTALQVSLYFYESQQWQLLTQSNQSNEVRIVNYMLPNSGTFAIAVESLGNFINYEVALAGAGGVRPELPRCSALIAPCPPSSPVNIPATTLINQETVSGSITSISPIMAYQFQAFEGDIVDLDMQRTSGDLDTFLGLADSNGNILIRDAGSSPNTSSIANFQIPTDGCYFVYATRDNNSETEGEFVITANGISDMTKREPPPPSEMSFGGDLSLGETIDGEIDNDTPQVVYRLFAEREGPITVNAVRSSGDLAPAVQILDGKYNQVAFASANLFGDASNPLSVDLEAGEYYFIVVQREGGASGTTSGVFTLTLSN